MSSTAYLEIVQSYYDSRSAKYDDSFHPKFARYLATRALESPSPLSNIPLVLDLACGTGLVTFSILELTPADTRIYGVDLANGMLSVALSKADSLPQDQQARLRFFQHDMTNLSGISELNDLQGKFDIITCASAFVLLSDPRKAIVEWARWMKPRTGRLVLDVTHPHNYRSGVVMETVAKRMGIQLPYYRAWMTGEDALRQIVETDGLFEVMHIEFVEQWGGGVQQLDSGKEEANKQFDKLITAGAYKAMTQAMTKDKQTGVSARSLFEEEWAASASSNGKVEDLDGVYVMVAKRKQ